MKHQQLLLKLNVDEDKLRALCDRLPLRKPDRQIAYALAVLCSRAGAYAPEHGKGQAEIAQLAGVGVRTVQRRIKYLARYGILNIQRENGRANVYQFDNVMLFDCPRPTFDIYQERRPAAPVPTDARPAEVLPLFDQEDTTPAAAIEGPTLLERITRAAGCLFSRMFQKGVDETAASPDPAPAEPPPTAASPKENRRQSVGERNATAAISKKTAATSAGSDPEPPPTAAKTAAIFPPFHSPFHKEPPPEKQKSILHNPFHGDGILDSDSDSGETVKNADLPPGQRKIIWGQEIKEKDLSHPGRLQELYQIAVAQGFCLEIDTARINFFALAHYCKRARNMSNKVGLFSSNIDRTARDKFGKRFEEKLSQADEDWARQAIKQIDFPVYATKAERIQQA